MHLIRYSTCIANSKGINSEICQNLSPEALLISRLELHHLLKAYSITNPISSKTAEIIRTRFHRVIREEFLWCRAETITDIKALSRAQPWDITTRERQEDQGMEDW